MSAARPRVSILIVNWNGAEHLPTCLDSLLKQSFRDFEVVLVDNGSRDGSVQLLRQHYPWVRLVRLEHNSGFAAGNNRGLEAARGDYIVTLNNDTRTDPHWLEHLVWVADARPRVGMVGCRICSFADPDVIDSLGMGICRDGMSRGRYRNRRWSSLNLPPVADALFPSACAALYRREMLQEIGFFDEDFFAYAEDTDLGLRGRFAGWQAVLALEAVVYHKYSQTAGEFSPLKVRLVERNHYWVALKNFPLRSLAALPLATVCRYAVQVRQVTGGTGAGGEFIASGSRLALLGALCRGTAQALTGAPRMLRKRRRIMYGKTIGGQEMRSLLNAYRITFSELLGGE